MADPTTLMPKVIAPLNSKPSGKLVQPEPETPIVAVSPAAATVAMRGEAVVIAPLAAILRLATTPPAAAVVASFDTANDWSRRRFPAVILNVCAATPATPSVIGDTVV